MTNAVEVGSRLFGLQDSKWLVELNEAAAEAEPRIHVHQFGAHLFHTSIERWWDFLNRTSASTDDVHRVYATDDGEVYRMPITLSMIHQTSARPSLLSPSKQASLLAKTLKTSTSRACRSSAQTFTRHSSTFNFEFSRGRAVVAHSGSRAGGTCHRRLLVHSAMEPRRRPCAAHAHRAVRRRSPERDCHGEKAFTIRPMSRFAERGMSRTIRSAPLHAASGNRFSKLMEGEKNVFVGGRLDSYESHDMYVAIESDLSMLDNQHDPVTGGTA